MRGKLGLISSSFPQPCLLPTHPKKIIGRKRKGEKKNCIRCISGGPNIYFWISRRITRTKWKGNNYRNKFPRFLLKLQCGLEQIEQNWQWLGKFQGKLNLQFFGQQQQQLHKISIFFLLLSLTSLLLLLRKNAIQDALGGSPPHFGFLYKLATSSYPTKRREKINDAGTVEILSPSPFFLFLPRKKRHKLLGGGRNMWHLCFRTKKGGNTFLKATFRFPS